MKTLSALAATLFALVLWQAIVTLTGLPKFILPGPALVAPSNSYLSLAHTDWTKPEEVRFDDPSLRWYFLPNL